MDLSLLMSRLDKKGFHPCLVKNREQAAAVLLSLTSEDRTVGRGGSVTLDQLAVCPMLIEEGKTVFYGAYAKEQGLSGDMTRLSMTADVFLTSTNALTMEGDLVNIDGRGNRLGAMIYGPEKVIVVAGVNKIVPDYAAALHRIKHTACPENGRRLHKNTPCALTGACGNCDNEGRMCRVTLHTEYPPRGREYHVILVEEDLGY